MTINENAVDTRTADVPDHDTRNCKHCATVHRTVTLTSEQIDYLRDLINIDLEGMDDLNTQDEICTGPDREAAHQVADALGIPR